MIANATRDWKWVLVGGIVSVALGILAWSAPVYATRSVVFALGVILLISGIVSLTQAFRFSRYGGTGWRAFQSLLAIAGGFIMLRYPVAGTIGVAMTICFYLFVSAAAQLIMAMDLRSMGPMNSAGWLFFSSLVSFALGLILLFQMPVSAFYIPGVFLAVDLVIAGFSSIGLALQMQKMHRTAELMTSPKEPPQIAA